MAKKKRKKRKTKKKAGRPAVKKRSRRTTKKKSRRTRNPLASASLRELQAELERRESEVAHLQDRREELVAELQDIDKTLTEFGAIDGRARAGRPPKRRGPGRPPGSGRKVTRRQGRGRGRNKLNLVESLQKVLAGRTMSVSEVSDAVQRAGYKTKSPNFRTIVNQALIKHTNVFRKVDRGQYTAK